MTRVDTAAELRKIVTEIRRTPIRLDTWNPAILKAADELDALRAEVDLLTTLIRDALSCWEDVPALTVVGQEWKKHWQRTARAAVDRIEGEAMNCPGDVLCQLMEHKGYDSCQRSGQCQFERDRVLRQEARAKAPYPDFCMQPFVCSITGRCMREPTCID